MATKIFVKEKMNKNVKQELLNSLWRKGEDEDEETEINTVSNLIEAIEIMNHYEETIKTQHKQVIQYMYKQGEILKMFKETEIFFDGTGKNLPTIYFKIAVYKVLKKTLFSKNQHYHQVSVKITWK